MYPSAVTTIAACFACLIWPTFGALAQTAPNGAEMATGDVWRSREELIYVPREALELPNASETGETELATGDVWPTSKPQGDVTQGRPALNNTPKKTPDRASR
jgi:hypothetical protein